MAEKSYGGDFFAGLVIGALVGAAAALLLAPQSGEETRTLIQEKGIELQERSAEMSTEARRRAERYQAEARQKAEQVANQAKAKTAELQKQAQSAIGEAGSIEAQMEEAAEIELKSAESTEE